MKYQDISSLEEDNENKTVHIKVCTRLRPVVSCDFVKSKLARASPEICAVLGPDGQTIELRRDQFEKRMFRFDYSLDVRTSDEEFYRLCCRNVVNNVIFEGHNGACLAYGQTGSGKTRTLLGSEKENNGVLHYALDDIFRTKTKREYHGLYSCVKMSVIELYNEQFFDLLSPIGRESALKCRENRKGFYLEGLIEQVCNDFSETQQVISECIRNRKKRKTFQNFESSRSHCVIKIILEFEEGSVINDDDTVLFKSPRRFSPMKEDPIEIHSSFESSPILSHVHQDYMDRYQRMDSELDWSLKFARSLHLSPRGTSLGDSESVYSEMLSSRFDHIDREEGDKNIQLRRRSLMIVDLAGSERILKSHGHDYQGSSTSSILTKNSFWKNGRVNESININKSISALGNVISALSEMSISTEKNQRGRAAAARHSLGASASHVPFRDSKLTRLLEEVFLDHCEVVLLCTISPVFVDYEETISTLLFASRAMKVRKKLKKAAVEEYRLIRQGTKRDDEMEHTRAENTVNEDNNGNDDDEKKEPMKKTPPAIWLSDLTSNEEDGPAGPSFSGRNDDSCSSKSNSNSSSRSSVYALDSYGSFLGHSHHNIERSRNSSRNVEDLDQEPNDTLKDYLPVNLSPSHGSINGGLNDFSTHNVPQSRILPIKEFLGILVPATQLLQQITSSDDTDRKEDFFASSCKPSLIDIQSNDLENLYEFDIQLENPQICEKRLERIHGAGKNVEGMLQHSREVIVEEKDLLSATSSQAKLKDKHIVSDNVNGSDSDSYSDRDSVNGSDSPSDSHSDSHSDAMPITEALANQDVIESHNSSMPSISGEDCSVDSRLKDSNHEMKGSASLLSVGSKQLRIEVAPSEKEKNDVANVVDGDDDDDDYSIHSQNSHVFDENGFADPHEGWVPPVGTSGFASIVHSPYLLRKSFVYPSSSQTQVKSSSSSPVPSPSPSPSHSSSLSTNKASLLQKSMLSMMLKRSIDLKPVQNSDDSSPRYQETSISNKASLRKDQLDVEPEKKSPRLSYQKRTILDKNQVHPHQLGVSSMDDFQDDQESGISDSKNSLEMEMTSFEESPVPRSPLTRHPILDPNSDTQHRFLSSMNNISSPLPDPSQSSLEERCPSPFHGDDYFYRNLALLHDDSREAERPLKISLSNHVPFSS